MIVNGPNAEMQTLLPKAIAPALTTTTTAGTVTVDWSQGELQSVILQSNTTFAFANAVPGQTVDLIIQYTGSGGTGTFPSNCYFSGGTKTLSTVTTYTDKVSIQATQLGTYLAALTTHYS